MKKYRTKYLLNADVATLKEIIKDESNDSVLWHPLSRAKSNDAHYFHFLIINKMHEHLTLLKPTDQMALDVVTRSDKGLNFIQLASSHVTDERMANAIKPFIEAAVAQDITLLSKSKYPELAPLIIAISNNNLVMLNALFESLRQNIKTQDAALMGSIFTRKDERNQRQSLYEFAHSQLSVNNEILETLKKHGTHLFETSGSADSDIEPAFSSTEIFKRSVEGHGSSSSITLPGTTDYWLTVMRALQKHHIGSILTMKKYMAFEAAITTNEITPSADMDIKLLGELNFLVHTDTLIMSDLLATYRSANPMKALSHKIINLDREDPASSIRLAKITSNILLAMSTAGFIYYVINFNNLIELARDERDQLKSDYRDCDWVTKSNLKYSGDLTAILCEPKIKQWDCKNTTEPWYEDYAKLYHDCQKNYTLGRTLGIGGIPLYLSYYFLLLTYSGAWYEAYDGEIKAKYINFFKSMSVLPFHLYTKTIGSYDTENVRYDKQRIVDAIKTALSAFESIFEGHEKDTINKTRAMMNQSISSLKIKEIIDASEAVIALIGHYSAHVKHLSLNNRIDIKVLEEMIGAFKGVKVAPAETPVKSPLITQYRASLVKNVNLSVNNHDRDLESGEPNESTGLIQNTRKNTKCTIV